MRGDKRISLLDAAGEVLAERGLAGTTVDEITTRAGVAKGTFYLYFDSKDAVIHALQQRFWEELLAAAQEALSEVRAEVDWWAVVDKFIETVVDFDLERRDWLRVIAQGWTAPVPDDVLASEDQCVAIMTAAITEGVARGVCHTADAEMTATLLYRAVQGTSHQLIREPGDVDRDRLLEGIRELVRKSLALPP